MEIYQNLEFLIARIREIDHQLQLLNEERSQLREQLQQCLIQLNLKKYKQNVNNEIVSASLTSRVNIKYDENRLKLALGEKYPLILELDIKKIKDQLSFLEKTLSPFIEKIGSPSRKLIEKKILAGELTVSEFKGTFEKSVIETLYIRARKSIINEPPSTT